MHRFAGLLFILLGIVGGWRLGQPPESPAVEEVSAAQAWEHYRAEAAAARQCKHDIPPHPIWVAFALGTVSTGVLLAASSDRRRVLAEAFLNVRLEKIGGPL